MIAAILCMLFGKLFMEGGNMDSNRKTAYNTLLDIENKKSYSNLALNHNIILYKPESPAFVRELVYGVLENKIYLDYIIGQFVHSGLNKVKKSDRTILRMAVYQIQFMDMVPDYAAVDESVDMSKSFAKGREGFINAVLRNFLRHKDDVKLPDKETDRIKYLSVKYSCEQWIIELWLEQYDIETVEIILKAGNETPPLTVRVNTLKTTPDKLTNRLESEGFQVLPSLKCDRALYVSGSGLLDTESYRKGLFSVQDESSMIAAETLDPRSGELVLDMCAAPGGKTHAMAEMMDNAGIVMASDIYTRKVDIIDKEAARLGIINVVTRSWDACRLDEELIGKADKVLVDAPCSGFGVMRRKPEIKYKNRDTEFEKLPQIQAKILKTSSLYVKSGGTLVYSTCTINLYENDRIVNDFLRDANDFREMQRFQLLPGKDGTDGFFICKMKRV